MYADLRVWKERARTKKEMRKMKSFDMEVRNKVSRKMREMAEIVMRGVI